MAPQPRLGLWSKWAFAASLEEDSDALVMLDAITAEVPEPAPLALLLAGLLGLTVAGWRRAPTQG